MGRAVGPKSPRSSLNRRPETAVDSGLLKYRLIRPYLLRTLLIALGVAALFQAGQRLFGPEHGLRAQYFSGLQTNDTPALTAVDDDVSTAGVQARWFGSAPRSFKVRWFGYLTVTTSGRYTIATTSDDGAALTLDGQALIEDMGPHAAHVQAATVWLTRGAHPVLIEYVQNGGPLLMEWQWAREGSPLEPVPQWILTPNRVTPTIVTATRVLNIATALLVGALIVVLGWRLVARSASGIRPVTRYPRLATLVFFCGLAAVHTWPMITDPAHLARNDNRDTLLNEWIVAWIPHQAVHAPLHLFDGNIFYPERHTVAYSEAMLVQAAMGAPLRWLGASPLLTYNVLLLLGFALSAWSMCLVVRKWTGDWTAGLVAGSIFAFCAHTLTRIPHLQAQHVEFLPPALYVLDELLTRPTTGKALRLAGWCILQALTSVYLMAITLFAVAAAVVARPEDWTRGRAASIARALAVAAIVSALALAPYLLPYYLASRATGLTRSLGDAANYSATWTDYLTTPARIHEQTWSARFASGTGLFPGALGLLLTLLAVIRGVALTDRRARMCLALGAAGVYLSFGPRAPGYALLYQVVPILHGIRATARFGYLATLAVAAVAGFGVVTLRSMTPRRMWPAIAPVLIVCASFESLAAPLGLSRFDGIAPIYRHIHQGSVVVEMPFFGPRSAQFHANYMINSTAHWQPMVNGYSGFQPPSFYQHAEVLQGFPDDRSMSMLRALGVTHVFVHTAQMPHETVEEVRARKGLMLVETFGETELYRVLR